VVIGPTFEAEQADALAFLDDLFDKEHVDPELHHNRRNAEV